MRLKHLELQGYKTFATRTGFAFDGGITAIVGPNGSGKSNIADAIRWVLGEQSYRSLRGKRTEDMIFSGSAQRARLGMAAASLTLDNADRWLPIDFSEVTITRRAYRSGENEYLLNGSRVRLRDITELLATSGLARRTYTVIGQGLVDAVLSLRPEDRRELFEEASGISLYQSKRAEALSRLEEMHLNLVRINDIVNEIAPRLRRLEREAERARHHAMLSQQLEGLLRTWYGYRWRQEQHNLQRAQDSLARREVALARRREALDELDRQMAALRVRQGQLREQLSGWHRESSGLHRQMEEVQRDLAVWQERARLLARQDDELQTELSELETQAQAAAERVAAAQAEVSAREAAFREEEAVVAEAQAALDAHESQRADLSRQMAKAQAQALNFTTQANDCRSRLDRLDERREALAEERAGHQAVIAEQRAAAEQVAAEIQAVAAEQDRLHAGQQALAAEAAKLNAELAAVQARQAEIQASLAETQRSYDRLRARYELLGRLRAEGEGLHAGIRAILQAASSQQPAASSKQQVAPQTQSTNLPTTNLPIPSPLGGIIGTVAQLLHVPAEYEGAIEVALGGHVQDVVVESWRDAEAAIAFLREGKRGRATFLPLDTVRPASRLDVPQDGGVVGVGADLVQAEGWLAPVVEMLLGRTVVVHDLRAARRTFERLQGGFQIVTLGGEVLRSSGSVTGGEGKGQAQGQVLAREREWRELPAYLKAARSRGREIEAELDQAQATEAEVRAGLSALDERFRAVEEALAQAQDRRRDLERDGESIAQQIGWRQGLVAQLDGESEELDAAESSLRPDLARLAAEQEEAAAQVAAYQAELDRLRGEVLYQRLSEARTAAALAQGRWEHRQAEAETLAANEARLRTQVEAKQQRIAALEEERGSLAAQVAGQASREAVIQGWLVSLAKKIEPAEAEVGRLEAEREQLEQDETTLRAHLRQAESSHSQALLAQSRQEDKLERLRRQIMDDFGLVQMEFTTGLAEQPPLPLGEMVSALPLVETLPEGLEEEIHQLRAQVRRMGGVNADAPVEYAEVLDRHTFLTTQAADLEEAARSLREVISELDDVMRQEFEATFQAVARRFAENFVQLFGGGSARLLLTDPEDVSQTGVEIVARPPGKRQQTLALLSGGERSLTAVALIFSILEVSPPPFCILDEVDAMLDEANVKRFRQALEALVQHTQFIVITHNRGTIQAANTIYGVSMGDDSVSQVVSLRLEGDRIAAPDGSTVDVVKAG
jgi:chromosome segregation protein